MAHLLPPSRGKGSYCRSPSNVIRAPRSLSNVIPASRSDNAESVAGRNPDKHPHDEHRDVRDTATEYCLSNSRVYACLGSRRDTRDTIAGAGMTLLSERRGHDGEEVGAIARLNGRRFILPLNLLAERREQLSKQCGSISHSRYCSTP